jgi:hypothetical protein
MTCFSVFIFSVRMLISQVNLELESLSWRSSSFDLKIWDLFWKMLCEERR